MTNKNLELYKELVRTACSVCDMNKKETKNAINYLNLYFETKGKINLDARTFAYQASTIYIRDFCEDMKMNQSKLENEVSDLCNVLNMEEQGSVILK